MKEFKVVNGKGIIKRGVELIPYEAFQGCSKLTSVVIPSSVTDIESGAFEDCSSLETITVSAGNKKYESPKESNAVIEKESQTLVLGCKNTKIPSTVTAIEDSAFYTCSELRNIEIPPLVTKIGPNAFRECKNLNGIVLPPSVREIGEMAFQNCKSLNKIVIPASVTTIDSCTFAGCTSLKCVEFLGRVDFLDDSAFDDCFITTIIVPVAMKDYYKTLLPKDLHDRIVENGKISDEEIRLRVICSILSWHFANNEDRSTDDPKYKQLVSDAVKIADEVIFQLKQK